MPLFDPIYTAIINRRLDGAVLGFALPHALGAEALGVDAGSIGPNRAGPGDCSTAGRWRKVFLKEEVFPTIVDKVFYILAPAVAVGTALLALAIVPFGSTTPVPKPCPCRKFKPSPFSTAIPFQPCTCPQVAAAGENPRARQPLQ